jgi:hypothetical protein
MTTLVPKFQQAGTDAVNRVSTAKMAERISVWDFIPVGTNTATTDCTAYIQAAVDYIDTLGGGTLYFPTGTYLLEGVYTPLQDPSRASDGVKICNNLTLCGDGNSSIIEQAANCCFSFTTRFFVPITDPANSITNIIFRDLQFTKPDAYYYPISNHLNLESVNRVLIDNCTFTGWSGDAVVFGFLTDTLYSTWLQSYVQNVIVTNSYFDGVNSHNDNAQAFMFNSAENVIIQNNYFANISCAAQPGAIDVEPRGVWAIVSNVLIDGNIFENNKGAEGSVNFVLYQYMTIPAINISITNNTFLNNTSTYEYHISGYPAADQTAVAPNAPSNILISGNVIQSLTSRIMFLGGCRDIVVENETIARLLSNHDANNAPAIIGYQDLTPGTPYGNQPIEGLKFNNNCFRNLVISTSIYFPVFQVAGAVIGGEFNNNKFTNCGTYDGGFGNMTCLGFTGQGIYSYGISVSLNTFINNGVFSSASVPLIDGGITIPNRFSLQSNMFVEGFTSNVYSSTTSGLVSLYINTVNTPYPVTARPSKTVATATATATTLFSPPAVGLYIIYAYQENASSVAYTAQASVINTGGGVFLISANNGANMTITVSGSNVQVTQTSGSNMLVNFNYIYINA